MLVEIKNIFYISRKILIYLLGLIRAAGEETRSVSVKENIKDERISKRKHNHSIAAALYKLGRDKLSIKCPTKLTNCLSF
jgi:hypothetical protein